MVEAQIRKFRDIVAANRISEATDKLGSKAKSRIAMPTIALLAADELRQRRQREALFGKKFFGDPAWDMLLNIFYREQTGRSACISSAGAVADIPLTTSLRYVVALEEAGHICRHPDRNDSRRTLLKLTDQGRQKMVDYLLCSPLIVVPSTGQ